MLTTPVVVFAGVAATQPVIIDASGTSGTSQATCSITSFIALKTSIDAGTTTTLTWKTAGCVSVRINGVTVTGSGSKQSDVMGTISKQYVLYASDNTISTQQTITLTPAAAVDTCKINSFTANPTTVALGGTVVLSWDTSGCDNSIAINGSAVNASGTKSYPIASSSTATVAGPYTLFGKSGIVNAVAKTQTISVPIIASTSTSTGTSTSTSTSTTASCTISSLTATPTSVTSGTAAVLAWSTSGCATAYLDGASVAVTGTQSTGTLTAGRTYTLMAYATGSVTAAVKSVTVQIGTSTSSSSSTTSSGTSTDPSVAVLSPVGGETFMPGRQITVQWTSKNIPSSELVRIGLLSDENTGLIAINPMSVQNSGQSLYTLPGASELANSVPVLSQGKRFTIMVYSTAYNASGVSANKFSIGTDGTGLSGTTSNSSATSSGVTVVSPNGGEAFAQGTPFTISWKNGVIDTRIGLMKASATAPDQSAIVGWIALTGAPTGNVSWDGKGVYQYTNSSGKIPVIPGDYRIIAVSQNSTGDYVVPNGSSTSDSNVDISNQPFTILVAGAAGTDTGIDEFAGTGENPIVTPEDEKMFDASWEATGVSANGATVSIATNGATLIVEFPDEPNLTVDNDTKDTTTPSNPATFKKLDRGAKGATVKIVQTALKKKGYLKAKTTGFYGLLTKNAVKKYQKKVKLPVTGIVDKKTFSLLTGK